VCICDEAGEAIALAEPMSLLQHIATEAAKPQPPSVSPQSLPQSVPAGAATGLANA
jgi:hypothetical protein